MSLRRIFIAFLLLLLAVQPAAAVTVCPHAMNAEVAPAAAVPAEMPCHHGETAAQEDMGASGEMAPGLAGGDGPRHSCCVTFACGLCSGLPQAAPVMSGASRHEKLAAAPASRFVSFVPDSPQRPPSIRA